MKLIDMKPKSVTFEVCGLELTFLPFKIKNELSIQDMFESYKDLQKALTDYDFEKLSVLAWYQLDIKSQRLIIKAVETVSIHHETGKETPVSMTPIEKFKALFLGIGDQITLIQNLFHCRGLNVPDLEDKEAVKKWAAQMKEMQSTGPESLTT